MEIFSDMAFWPYSGSSETLGTNLNVGKWGDPLITGSRKEGAEPRLGSSWQSKPAPRSSWWTRPATLARGMADTKDGPRIHGAPCPTLRLAVDNGMESGAKLRGFESPADILKVNKDIPVQQPCC